MSESLVSEGLVGVAGRPIEHSLSPQLHRAAFVALGLDWESRRFDVGAGGGAGVVAAMRSLGLVGLSITMPLKEEVAGAVELLDEQAALLGSVNCLAWEDDQIIGLSTDGLGLLACLERVAGFECAGQRVVLAGAGGAARSVAAALGSAGALEVSVVARDASAAARAASLAGEAGRVGSPADAALADLVIEATPVGMAGTASEAMTSLLDPSLLHEGQLVVDLVYSPRRTTWLEAAVTQGAQGVGGLGMLVHQAALQIERWTGRSAPVEAMWAAVEVDQG